MLVPYLRCLGRLAALPWYFATQVNRVECPLPAWRIVSDLLYIFFVLRYYPDNYAACRLWEVPRPSWAWYYGSSYNPFQRARLRREVQRSIYMILFEDKEVSALLCRGADLPQPRLLGILDPATDYRTELQSMVEVAGLARAIIKPVAGSAGRGIVVFEFEGGTQRLRGGHVETDLGEFRLESRAVVQELLVQDPALADLAAEALSTVRVVTFLTRDGRLLVLGATMRFGVQGSFIDNWSAGGVAVGVDVDAGRLAAAGYDKRGRRYFRHPDTEVPFSGREVPRWREVLALAERTQRAFGYYRLLGMDVGITDSGPCLIEINAQPDLVFQEQTSGPILARPGVFAAFAAESLLISPLQRKLAARQPATAGES
jgi:glutathione synthase/RimK-type ligase-like ATP-grasp enzyme